MIVWIVTNYSTRGRLLNQTHTAHVANVIIICFYKEVGHFFGDIGPDVVVLNNFQF